MLRDIGYVLEKLDWMRAERIWPNGLRYLWTDAFGLVLFVSLYRKFGEQWLDQAEELVRNVEDGRGLERPYPGYGFGSMDAYDGYISYRILDEKALAPEIADMRALIERDWRTLAIEQDLGLGMMLGLGRFFP